MLVTAIIAAGGRGRRLGGGLPKQLLTVGGRSILERSVAAFLGHPAVDELVVALPADLVAEPPAYLRAAPKPIRLVAGGLRRQDSVLNAFQVADERSDVIVVHDAARPFPSARLIALTIAAAAEAGAALAALPSRDTVKRSAPVPAAADEDADPGKATESDADPAKAGAHSRILPIVAETLPRESIFLAQTPQAFRRHVLKDALALGETGVEATDEATLAERAGYVVRLIEGEPTNIKITTPEDLAMAEVIARGAHGTTSIAGQATDLAATAAERAPFRIGAGYDLHRLVEGRPLILAGVTIPFDRGLAGHSDADAICHAVTDALLGAAAAGDIGGYFPDTDPQWRGASSIDLLRRATEVVREAGYFVANVDIVVIAERPTLLPFVGAMRANLAAAIGVGVGAVGIKGKTNEGVGALGRGEAIAVHAVALIVREGVGSRE